MLVAIKKYKFYIIKTEFYKFIIIGIVTCSTRPRQARQSEVKGS